MVLDVNRAAEDLEYRRAWTKNLVEKLELTFTSHTEEFLREWPAVNRNSPRHAGTLDDKMVSRRVKQFKDGRSFTVLITLTDQWLAGDMAFDDSRDASRHIFLACLATLLHPFGETNWKQVLLTIVS